MPGKSKKGKGPNPRKIAAAAIKNSDAVTLALSGHYQVGLVLNALGNKSFRIRLEKGKDNAGTRIVAITSKTFQGGEHSLCFARRDDWLIVDGSEVQGVLNRKNAHFFRELTKAGRVPDLGVSTGLDEYFDMEEDEDAEEAEKTWEGKDAKSLRQKEEMESRMAQAQEFVARIRARRAGLLKKLKAKELEEVAEQDADDGDGAPPADEAEALAEMMGLGGGAVGGAAPAAAPEGKREADPKSRRQRARFAAGGGPEEEDEEEAAARAATAAMYAEAERLAAQEEAAEAALAALQAAMGEMGWEEAAELNIDDI